MTKRILVTGATGFVGTYLIGALQRRWPVSTIRGLGGAVDAVSGAADIVDLRDVAAVDAIVSTFLPDLVIHLAAQSSVARGEDAGALTWQVNLSGTLNLALAVARHTPQATMLFASTGEVYGASFLGSPVDEASATLPLNAYAKSKAAAERLLADVLPASCHLIIARAFNHTGPGQRPDFVLPSFARQIALIESGRQEPRMMVGNLDVRRDFLDVGDVVEAYILLVQAAPRLPPRFVVNVASGIPRLLREVADQLRLSAKIPVEVVIDPGRVRAVDLPLASAKPDLLRAVTGWEQRYEFGDTLIALLDHARRMNASS